MAGLWGSLQEHGSDENLNGLIRRYLPNRTIFNTFADVFIQNIQDQLNLSPRERFNFATPINQFNRLTRRPYYCVNWCEPTC